MKKCIIFFLFMSIAITCITSSAIAGGEVNNSNQTAKYFRDFTPFTDADAIYNPAGTAFDSRNSISYGLQFVFKNYCSGDPTGCAQDLSLIPDFSTYYHYTDNLNLVAAFYISAGGGVTDYKSGNSATQIFSNVFKAGGLPIASEHIKADSAYYTLKLGPAYKINNYFSVSAGILFVRAEEAVSGEIKTGLDAYSAEIDSEYEDDGFGFFTSLHYKPNSLWNLALNYNSQVDIEYSPTINKNIVNSGSTTIAPLKTESLRKDLPAVLTFGVAKKFIDSQDGDVELKAGFTYFFQKDATWDDQFTTIPGLYTSVDDRASQYDDGFEVSLGVSRQPKDSQFKYYIGYLHSDAGAYKELTSYFKPGLDSKSLGTGFDYIISEQWTFNFAVSQNFYQGVTRESGVILKKSGVNASVGAEYYF